MNRTSRECDFLVVQATLPPLDGTRNRFLPRT